MKFLGTVNLETKRLLLRRINNNDYKKAFNNWCSSDAVTKYVLWDTHKDINETKSIFESMIKKYEDNNSFEWIIELKENKEVIGTIDISKKFLKFGVCEIGYCIGEKFWNKGYTTEAYSVVIKYLFEECDARYMIGTSYEKNIASIKVMEKCGLKFETKLRERVFDKDGILNDLVIYSYSYKEYQEDKRKF